MLQLSLFFVMVILLSLTSNRSCGIARAIFRRGLGGRGVFPLGRGAALLCTTVGRIGRGAALLCTISDSCNSGRIGAASAPTPAPVPASLASLASTASTASAFDSGGVGGGGVRSTFSTRTIEGIHAESLALLEQGRVPEAEESARYLLCGATNIGYRFSDFQREKSRELSAVELDTFTQFLSRRLNREPVQYIIGNWDFFGHEYLCKPPVLIPRPETEDLIDKIVTSGVLGYTKAPRILDVGAGTGVIGISLLTQLPLGSTCVSLDINPVAVSLANSNAARILGPAASKERYKCIEMSFSDFAESISSRSGGGNGRNGDDNTEVVDNEDHLFDIVVSNPPYIPSADVDELEPEVRLHEDRGALDGGADGLLIVRDLIARSPQLLKRRGSRELWIEVSEMHPSLLVELLAKEKEMGKVGSQVTIEPLEDCFGNPRFVRLKFD